MTERKQIYLQKDNTQAALEFALTRTNKRLELFKEYNSGIPEKDLMREFAQNEGIYWEDLEPIINAAKRQLDQYRENINADTHSALDALERLLSYTNGLGDGAAYTIRAALTAQLTKTDDNVSCPSVANAGDINAELLEALKEAWSVISSINYGKNHVIKRSDGEVLYGQTDEWCMWALEEVLPKVEQAIARASAQQNHTCQTCKAKDRGRC